MGRFCNGLLTAFRVVQYILSIIALGCGAYITYEMYTMSDSADVLEKSISSLLNESPDNETYQNLKKWTFPVLDVLQGTPIRAIIVSVVGLWSLIIITYLFFAHRSQNHQATNKRSIRVMLELVTLVAWIASIVCSIMLALQYGVMAVTVGGEAKVAVEVSKELLKQAIQEAASSNTNATAVLNIVSNMITIGGLAIASVVASVFCGTVSFVSLIVACCMSGKKRKQDSEHGADVSMIADPDTIGYVGYVGKKAPLVRVSNEVPYEQTSAMLTTRYS